MKTIRIFAAVLVAALALSCKSNSDVKVDVKLPTHAETDSVSYLIGVHFGSILKGSGICDNLSEINMSELKKGMADFLKAEGSPYEEEFFDQFKISPQEINRIINEYLTKKHEYKAAVNKAKGDKFLEENLKNGVNTTASGLQYTIIEEGAEYKIQPKDTVWVFYSGKTIDGKEFDGNMGDDEPREFIANRVIKGWTEGLGLLGEGGKATLYIPSDIAYGERGGQSVEPNSVLIFEVEVQKVGKFVEKEEAPETKTAAKKSENPKGKTVYKEN